MHLSRPAVALALFGFAALALAATVPEEPARNPYAADALLLPVELPDLRAGREQAVVKDHCLLCHSTDYMATQPPLNRAQWTAGVEKMRTRFGATIATNRVPAIVEYLVTTYGTEAPPR